MSRLEVPSSSHESGKVSSSSTSTTSHYARLPQKPELHRAIALYDYHDADDRNFQLNVGDEISVREHCDWGWWLGINLRMNKIGIFPPSHVQNVPPIDTKAETSPGVAGELGKDITETNGEVVASTQVDKERTESRLKTGAEAMEYFNGKFNTKLDSETTPRAVLNILTRMVTFDAWVFWLCFCLVYPNIFQDVLDLHHAFRDVLQLMYRKPKEEVNLFIYSSESQVWNFVNDYRFQTNYWSQKQWKLWESVKERLEIAINRCSEKLEGFKRKRSSITESFGCLDDLTERLDGLVADLRSQLVSMKAKVQSALEDDAKEVREEERRHRDAIVEMGISKTGSWSSSIEFPTTINNMRNRIGQNGNMVLFDEEDAKEKTRKSFHHRIKDKVLGRSKDPFEDQDEEHLTIWQILGDTPAVLKIVICLTVISAVTIALAAWRCEPPDTIPIIDSNFWSTLSSAVVGIASLYCTTIPLLLGHQLKVDDPKLFRILLWGSLFFALMAVSVYPFQTRVSMVVLSISSYAQLATTLQLIMGAVRKIKEQTDRIEELEYPGRVRNVKRKGLGRARR